MLDYNNIAIEDYTYPLPPERIAKYPLSERDKSKLLVYRDGDIIDDKFKNLSKHIAPDTLLVFNNTKVIQARINFYKETGAKIEIFCLEPIVPSDFILSFSEKGKVVWKCIVGNLRKWKDNDLSTKFMINDVEYSLTATKIENKQSYQIIEFLWDNSLTFSEVLENIGNTPIPPYLNRASEISDKERYQTIYSKHKGSVAAPTAGLHFTDNVFDDLENKKIERAELTLHVGAGTFKPVKTEKIVDHEMHIEQFFVTKQIVEKLLSSLSNIIAVGTTSLRSLESLYWLGVKLITENINSEQQLFISQWEAFESEQSISANDALNAVIKYMETCNLDWLHASTQIIIVPGYKFRLAKAIVTNYHQPRSTLLLLIAALIKDDWRKIYQHALDNDYRFLSYGDSSLLFVNS